MADSPATTLSHHTQIHARLQLEILDAREEIARLKAELRADQDPERMGHIQRQIGVSRALRCTCQLGQTRGETTC